MVEVRTRKNTVSSSFLCSLGLFIISMVLLLVFYSSPFNYTASSSSSPQENSYKALFDTIHLSSTEETTTTTTTTTTTQAQEQQHHCVNTDFVPQHAVGVWTMLNDNMNYVQGAVKLGKSITAHTTTPVDLVVMELQAKPLSDASWEMLAAVGFRKCSVRSIPAPRATRSDLQEKFAVLHVWAMEVYDTVVFLDADTYPTQSIDALIHTDLHGKAVGVTQDIRAKQWVETFNSGVMVLHPSLAEHKRLLTLLHSGLVFEYIMSDQGFLNAVYKNNWHEIGFVNNANLAVYRFQREFWDQYKLSDINIIHYTMSKPWKCKSKGPYGPLCDVWINAP